MARYYESTATTPISQFQELPLDYMAGKLEDRQILRDTVSDQMDLGAYVTADFIPESTTDMPALGVLQQSFTDQLSKAQDYLDQDDLEGASTVIDQASKQFGVYKDDEGNLVYKDNSPFKMMEKNLETWNTNNEIIDKGLASGDYNLADAWYMKDLALQDYDAAGGAYTGTVLQMDLLPARVDYAEKMNSFMNDWKSSGSEWMTDLGDYIGVAGKEEVTYDEVYNAGKSYLEDQQQFKDQTAIDWAYLTQNGQTNQTYEEYYNDQLNAALNIFAERESFKDTTLGSLQKSIAGEYSLGTSLLDYEHLYNTDTVLGITSGGDTITTDDVATMNTNISELSTNISNAEGNVATQKEALTTYFSNLDTELGLQAGTAQDALSSAISIDSSGQYSIDEDVASNILETLGATDSGTNIASITSLSSNYNNAVSNKKDLEIQKAQLDVIKDDLMYSMENATTEDGDSYIDWDFMYDDFLEKGTFEAWGYNQDDVKGLVSIDEFKEMVRNGDPKSFISKVWEELVDTGGAVVGTAVALGDIPGLIAGDYDINLSTDEQEMLQNLTDLTDAYSKSYNNQIDKYVDSGEYKSTSRIFYSSATTSGGIGEFNDVFQQALTTDNIGAFTTSYGDAADQTLKNAGFNLDEGITYDNVQIGTAYGKPAITVTASQGGNTKAITLNLDKLEQPSVYTAAKDLVTDQYLASENLFANKGTGADVMDQMATIYGMMMVGDQLPPQDLNLKENEMYPMTDGEGRKWTLIGVAGNNYQIGLVNEGEGTISVFDDIYSDVEAANMGIGHAALTQDKDNVYGALNTNLVNESDLNEISYWQNN